MNSEIDSISTAESKPIDSLPPIDPSFAPVAQSERFEMLDVLRGFAILGILMPNIQAFSMITAAYSNPLAYGDFSGANYAVWLATRLLFEQKFLSLFSMMFGAGIILMTTRAEQKKTTGIWKIHYRRMFWLLVFGLLHAHLLWYGDILFCYALAGSAVFLLRKLSPKWLVVIGLAATFVGSLLFVAMGILIQILPADALEQMRAGWQPPPEAVQAEVEGYRGGWLSQAPFRSTMSLVIQVLIVPFSFFWRTGGLMLIGMALFKWGFITGQAKTRSYVNVILVAALVALPLIAWETWKNVSVNFDMFYSQFLGLIVNYWFAPVISLGYMSLIALICRFKLLGILRKSLAAVGQMAFTNYLGQTIICTTIFYGHGFGWYGYLERSEQFMVVVAVWIFQLIASPIWMHYFRFGPAEWVWRSLSYWKLQPMRK